MKQGVGFKVKIIFTSNKPLRNILYINHINCIRAGESQVGCQTEQDPMQDAKR